MNIRKLFTAIIKIVYPRIERVTINGEQVGAVFSLVIEHDPTDNIELKDTSIQGFTNHAYRGEQWRERREKRRDLAHLFENWERSREEDVFSLRRLFRCEVDFAPVTEEHRTFWEEEAARARQEWEAYAEHRAFWEEREADAEHRTFWEEEAARARQERQADVERRRRLELEEEERNFWEEEAARDRQEREADAEYWRRLGLEEEVEVVAVEDDDEDEEDEDEDEDGDDDDDDDPWQLRAIETARAGMDWREWLGDVQSRQRGHVERMREEMDWAPEEDEE